MTEDLNKNMSGGRSKYSKGYHDSCSIQQNERLAGYDEAFAKAGFGIWQYFLLLQCGWANAGDAIEIMCISFIIPSVRDDMHVSHAALSGLSLVLFLGMMIGGYVWGSLADTYGRRRIICISLAINAIFGALSAAVPTYWLLLLFRFFSGIGAGGSLPVVFTYFSEFQPTKYRGAMISALAMCWMAGNLVVGFMAWGLLPESEVISDFSPYGQQWRLFSIACAIPSLTSSIFFHCMPESPKYLYTHSRYYESLQVLKIIYKWNNHNRDPSTFGIDELLVAEREYLDENSLNTSATDQETENLLGSSQDHSNKRSADAIRQSNRRSVFGSLWSGLRYNFRILRFQFSSIYAFSRRATSIALTISYVLVSFGGYGMAMWTPVLMEKTEKYGGSPCRGHSGNMSVGTNVSNDSKDVYVDVLIGSAAQLPGNILTILAMDKLGAKVMLILTLLCSSVSVLCFWLVETKSSVIAMNAVYSGIQVGVWNSVDVITVEMFPTSIRSAATGNMNGISRLGAIAGTLIFGLFMDVDCSVPILTVFTVYFICSLISFKLPNTRSLDLQ